MIELTITATRVLADTILFLYGAAPHYTGSGMVKEHEYTVIGHSRTVIGRYIGTVVGIIASISSAVGVAGFKLAQTLGLGETGQVVLWPLTAAAIFPLAHLAFNHWIWNRLSWILKIPDLNGKWVCHGVSMDVDPPLDWLGEITISQTWEKIQVRLKTQKSSSHSISAALLYESKFGYRLMYSYRNDPEIGEPELSSHVGFCELVFDEDLTCASGDYFNNKGRTTFGRMRLTRKIANDK